MKVRLQKFMSECGVASRRHAEKLISEGKVKVNGKVVTELGTKVDPGVDKVIVSSKTLMQVEKGLILFNKPRGVVSTMSDPEGRKTIAHFLTARYRSYFPVGRLDTDSSGLMILTNDGELTQRLLHPSFELPRVYRCEVEGHPGRKVLERLGRGVQLDDGRARAEVDILGQGPDGTTVEVSIKEGRTHLVRRLLEKVGHRVLRLKRLSHGPFKLGALAAGQMRKLTEREYQTLRARVMGE